MAIDSLSVFFPTYNEEGNIKETVINTSRVLEKRFKRWEILIVDDGSNDKTNKVITDLSRSNPKIRVIRHPQNMGYGASLQTGFYNSVYDWIAFTDSDGQFNFEEISRFIEKQRDTNADLVIGFYKKRQVSKLKIFTSKMWEVSVRILFGLNVKDIDCGFKLVSRRVINKISRLESQRGAFVSSELLIKAKKSGFNIAEVDVTHYPRLNGKGTGRDLKVIFRSFVDLFKLWHKLR